MVNVFECEPNDVQTWLEEGSAILIDVREEQEVAIAPISGAVNLPLSTFDPINLMAFSLPLAH